MASITISELRPVGFELLDDSESFMNELSDSQMDVFGGGKRDININIFIGQVTISIGASLVRTRNRRRQE
jgi:hypothetical protein